MMQNRRILFILSQGNVTKSVACKLRFCDGFYCRASSNSYLYARLVERIVCGVLFI